MLAPRRTNCCGKRSANWLAPCKTLATQKHVRSRPAAAEAEALERLLAMPPPTEREASNRSSTSKASDPDDGWLIDLTRDMNNPLEDLVAGAVRSAVHKSLHPVVVRAGRYTVIRDPNHLN